LGSGQRAALQGAVNLPAMRNRDDKDSEAVVINRVNNAIVAGAKPQVLTLPVETLEPCRAGIRAQALDLVANPLPVGRRESGQLA